MKTVFKNLNQQKCVNDNKPICEQQEIINIGTSTESHRHWKKQFRKNSLYFRKMADFEADNEIDISSIRNQTTNIYKKNSVCKV